jgi:hypothetical protein
MLTGKALLPWKQSDFREEYAEALAELESFQRYLAMTLRECNGGTDPASIRENFEMAHMHYKKAGEIASSLDIRMGKRLEGKKRGDWTPQQIADNALVRSLAGIVSANMNHLQTAYQPWLMTEQFPPKSEKEE